MRESLTKAEYRVLRLIGFRRIQIAKKLGITLSTVQDHLTHIRQKLRVDSVTQAALMARSEGGLDVKEFDLGFWDKNGEYVEDWQIVDLKKE